MNRGYIKFWRKAEDSISWTRGLEHRGMMVTILDRAAWQPRFEWGIEVQPGEFLVKVIAWAETLGMSQTSVRRILKNLVDDGFISMTNVANRYTKITVLNWHVYQQDGSEERRTEGEQTANRRLTNGEQTANPSYKEEEGKKERRKDKKQIAPNPDGFRAESGTLVCDKALAKERTAKKEPPPRDDLSPYYLPVKSPDMSEVAYLKAENWITWVDTYGEAFCMACLKGAYSWALSNPVKVKTVAGLHKFFNTWLQNEQNKPGGSRASPPGRVGFGRYDGGQGQEYGESDFGASGGNA